MDDLTGSPTAMRATATGWRARATGLESLVGHVRAAAATPDFVGPAADQLRAAVAEHAGVVTGAAAELRGLAGELMRDADILEAAQRAALAAERAAAEAAVAEPSAGKDPAVQPTVTDPAEPADQGFG